MNKNIISYIPLAIQPIAIFNIINAPHRKGPQRISLKFGLNPFQVKVVLPPIFVLVCCPVLSDKWRNKKKVEKTKQNTRPPVTTYRQAKYPPYSRDDVGLPLASSTVAHVAL